MSHLEIISIHSGNNPYRISQKRGMLSKFILNKNTKISGSTLRSSDSFEATSTVPVIAQSPMRQGLWRFASPC